MLRAHRPTALAAGAASEAACLRKRLRTPEDKVFSTGELVDAEAADSVLINGVLGNGALLSYQLSSVPFQKPLKNILNS